MVGMDVNTPIVTTGNAQQNFRIHQLGLGLLHLLVRPAPAHPPHALPLTPALGSSRQPQPRRINTAHSFTEIYTIPLDQNGKHV